MKDILEEVKARASEGRRLHEISMALGSGAWADLSLRFSLIREAYKIIEGREYCPYPFYVSLTPIESHLWQDIRQWPGQVRMYPQYPVGRYFVDFGDPWKQVAIEADGKQWHDAERDRIRDEAIKGKGWTIYRVSGKETIQEDAIAKILDRHYPEEKRA